MIRVDNNNWGRRRFGDGKARAWWCFPQWGFDGVFGATGRGRWNKGRWAGRWSGEQGGLKGGGRGVDFVIVRLGEKEERGGSFWVIRETGRLVRGDF